ncbi:predicted protein [Nematostella vectensis]|uniref:Uncharacterized protein n=1 Tax=Nematostella vectensis TaxID=45351 RepID=A7RRC5_NEMVE|nr:predicted protein [Nematostella vectensis]|eukprot:XP_001638051.1 predicted protein [Nematostella vectensis]
MYLDKKNEVPPYRLTGPRSILKYIIILSTCLASACIVVAHRAFGNNYTWEYQTRYMLFLGTSLFGFLSSIIILVVFLTELDKVLCTRRVMEMILEFNLRRQSCGYLRAKYLQYLHPCYGPGRAHFKKVIATCLSLNISRDPLLVPLPQPNISALATVGGGVDALTLTILDKVDPRVHPLSPTNLKPFRMLRPVAALSDFTV